MHLLQVDFAGALQEMLICKYQGTFTTVENASLSFSEQQTKWIINFLFAKQCVFT